MLFAIYRRDVRADEDHGFATSAADQLISSTTPLERGTIAVWVREALADEEEAIAGFKRQAYGRFLLGLERDALDDEAYLRICRETGLTADLVDRLLGLGRIEEAARETRHVDDLAFLGLADLFVRHGQEAEAERLVKARIEEKPVLHVLEWLQKYYQTRGNLNAELEVATALFRAQPYLRRYQELRDFARRLERWEALRLELLAFLERTRNTTLIIQIALEEGNLDTALQLLKGMATKDSYGYTYNKGYGYYGFGDIALEVARAAEAVRPHEAIELYQQSAERLIALRGRQNYVEACKYLAKIRALHERLGEQEAWTRYVTTLREQNRNLRALKEELVEAGL